MTSRRRILGPTLILSLLYFVILSCLFNLYTCETTCQFPAEWNGEWFERGQTEYVRIQNGTISTKGTCVKHEPHNNKYILRNPKGDCYMCVVIHQKHINLLQYKQSFCLTRHSSLTALCSSITGDNPLLSVFRVNAESVPCPFSGRYTFSYNRGQRDCAQPRSTIDPCTDSSKLQFRFQSCYDVPKSQSSEEQLQCLASWREGPDKYVVGKMFRNVAKTDSELYRCFIYSANEDGSGYEVAESADASCDGVFLSPLTGARTMKLQKVEDDTSCQFPRWMSNMREWHLLNRDEKYLFKDRNATLVVIDQLSHPDIQSTIRCIKDISSDDHYARYVVHVTAGCDNGYRCMEIFHRHKNVIQYKQGGISRHKDSACSNRYYDSRHADPITLKAHISKVKSQITGSISQAVTDAKYPTKSVTESDNSLNTKCPYHGEYIAKNTIIRNPIKPGCNTSFLSIGCQSDYSMEIHAKCSMSSNTNKDRFYCHGNWTEGQTHYVIASKIDTKDDYCLLYREHDDGLYFTIKQSKCNSEEQSSSVQNSHDVLFHKQGQCSVDNEASAGCIIPFKLLLLSFIITMNKFHLKLIS